MKLCSKCNIDKPISSFRRDKTKKSGYQHFCKDCAKTYYRSVYSEKYSSKYNERNNKRRAYHMSLLTEYKNNLQCVICDESENVCLDFHHLNPDKKDFTIAVSLGRNWSSIEEELKKCVVLCANCHRKVHAGIIQLDV